MDAEIVMTVKQIEDDRLAWLKMRKKGIGGSDAGVILGKSPWSTPYALWAEKTGQVETEDKVGESEAIYWGTVLEETVAREFTKRTDKKVKRLGMLRNKEYPWMLADLDRILVGENAGLECKTAAGWMKDKWKDDEIPTTYYCQVLHYMLVGGFDRFYIAVLLGGQEFRWKCIEREDVKSDLEALFEAEKKFWEEFVVPKKMPPIDGSEICTKALSKQFERCDENEVELGAEENLLCADIIKLKADIDVLQEQVNLKENKLREIMGGKEIGYAQDFKVTWKFGERSSLDTKKIKKEVPYIANNPNYWKKTVTRRFEIRGLKKESEE